MADEITTVRLSDISTDERTQIRTRTDPTHIATLAELYESDIPIDPIILFRSDGTYLIADGWHRFYAQKNLGRETCKAVIREGTESDIFLAACYANAQTRKPLSYPDKYRVAVYLIANWPQLSNRDLAELSGFAVSHAFVGKVKRELSPVENGNGGNGKKAPVAQAQPQQRRPDWNDEEKDIPSHLPGAASPSSATPTPIHNTSMGEEEEGDEEEWEDEPDTDEWEGEDESEDGAPAPQPEARSFEAPIPRPVPQRDPPPRSTAEYSQQRAKPEITAAYLSLTYTDGTEEFTAEYHMEEFHVIDACLQAQIAHLLIQGARRSTTQP